VFDAMRHQVPSGITADDAGIIAAWGGPGFSGHWTKKELTTDRDDDDDAASGRPT
jgi:hypothetical protein